MTTIALIVSLMALPCLPSRADELLPSATVLYLPLVCRNNVAERDKPELVTPKDGSQLASLAPEFVWRSVGQHWFSVEISTDPQFSTLAVSLPIGTYGSGLEHRASLLENLQMATLYHWRVGFDDDTGFFTWSRVGWFTTPGPGRPTPLAPLPALPTDGSTVDCLSPYLEWQCVTGARMYHITLNVQANMFTYSVLSPGAAEVLPFSLLPGRTYAWHVRAFNGFAWGPESVTWLFRTPTD